MRRQNVALTVFLLGPLVVLVILCWLIVGALRESAAREASRPPPAPAMSR